MLLGGIIAGVFFLPNIVTISSSNTRWPKPKCRDFAALIDHHVLAEVLEIASSTPSVSIVRLTSEDEGLGSRLRKLIKVRQPTRTSISALVTLLTRFRWLRKTNQADVFQLTEDGKVANDARKGDPAIFRRMVVESLHRDYLIPGWIVERLFAINPSGQGEVVLPSPRRSFATRQQTQTENGWTEELETETRDCVDVLSRQLPGSFPVDPQLWVDKVKFEWTRLGAETNRDGSRRKRKAATLGEQEPMFSVRARLLHAMREASVSLLFGAHWKDRDPDFLRPPLSCRAYQVWCPRLAELELIFYTDYHPNVSGRVIVPCSSFRKIVAISSNVADASFVPINIRSPDGVSLALHQPVWAATRSTFAAILKQVYTHTAHTSRVRYVSLLAVRDEACRRLRISALKFDEFLGKLYAENARGPLTDLAIDSMSIESDLRLDQRSAVGLTQRPVYINRVPQSLIAMKLL